MFWKKEFWEKFLEEFWEGSYKRSRRLWIKHEHGWRVSVATLLVALMLIIGFLAGLFSNLPEIIDLLGGGTSSPGEIVGYAFNFLVKATLAALPTIVAFRVIPGLTSRFVRALYDPGGREEAEALAHRLTFGMPGDRLHPLMIVKGGHIDLGAGSTCDRVGGPGLLVVYNDSVVVLERGGQLTRIQKPGITSIERFERVWEVINLGRQHWPFTVSAMTKDGIPISCQANVTFKIDDRFKNKSGNVHTRLPGGGESEMEGARAGLAGRPQARKRVDPELDTLLGSAEVVGPFPFTEAAVLKAATSTWVRIRDTDHKEQLRKWTGRVILGEVEGTLRNILAQYRLDWLIQPPQPGQELPRKQIQRELAERLEDTLRVDNSLGARLLQVDLGQIDVKSDRVSMQWAEAWQAEWEQRAAESVAEGEAEAARLEAVHIQAQAEMMLVLVESIRSLVSSAEDLPPYLLAARFIQTLRWMAYDPVKLAFLPPETLRTLDELEKSLGQTKGPDQRQQAGDKTPQDLMAAEIARRVRIEGGGR